ncbi:MAG: hypothetical protein WD423_05585 [Rhodothermales bacterium]
MKPDRIAGVDTGLSLTAVRSHPDFNLEALFGTSDQNVNDAVIEQFVRDPDSLPIGISQVVKESIAEDVGSQMMEAFYRTFYELLDRLPADTSSQVEAFVSSLFPSPDDVPGIPSTRSEIIPARRD